MPLFFLKIWFNRKFFRYQLFTLAKIDIMRFFLVLCCCSVLSWSQNNYPKGYFQSPLDIPLQMSGNFGELRSNHFHAGIDFRTLKKEGLNVYAAADGYISRFKISHTGYGKAVYITHPNGYTTVYAHLLRMAPEIESFLKKKHYTTQSFELDFNPAPGDLPVKKGQLIALSGNTGSSSGPHLHFEIRDSKTENIVNPMLFGFDALMPDTKPPKLHSLLVYPLGEDSAVNKSSVPIALDVKTEGTNHYIAQTVYASGKIGFSINADDPDDHSFSNNGLHAVSASFNGVSTFGYTFDTFNFDETRYINALIDYPRYKQTGQRFQRLYRRRPYNLSLLKTDLNGGIITALPNLSGTYKIDMEDFFGNKITVSVPIVYETPPAVKAIPKVGYFVQAGKDNLFQEGNASVFFPAAAFYEDFNLSFTADSSGLSLAPDDIPVHTAYTVTLPFPGGNLPQKKTFIALVDGAKKIYQATQFKDGMLSAKVKTLGKFIVDTDTIKPTIKPIKNIAEKWLSADNYLQFEVSDNYSGIAVIEGWLNGKWILLEYDSKSKTIVHDFSDGIYTAGRNDIKIQVKDNVGNCAIFETYFYKNFPEVKGN